MPCKLFNSCSSSPNGLWVNSPFGLRPHWLRGHEGQRNNCFSKIQLVGQEYRDKTTLGSKTRFSRHCFGFTDLAKNLAVTKISYWLFKVLTLIILQQGEGLTSVNKNNRANSSGEQKKSKIKLSEVSTSLEYAKKFKWNLVVLVVHYLIQENKWRILQQSSRYCHSLLLASTQLQPTFTNDCFISWDRRDEMTNIHTRITVFPQIRTLIKISAPFLPLTLIF